MVTLSTVNSSTVGTGRSNISDPVYLKHSKLINQVTSIQPNDSLNKFKAHYQQNQARYEAVAAQVNIPPSFIAALNWREQTGSFNGYFHNGCPLGKPSDKVPTDIPVMNTWEESVVHAFGRFKGDIQKLGITKDTTDMAALATLAEKYNGLGYHNKGRISPYVYNNTPLYTGGKYVADGQFSASEVDKQAGVVAMVASVSSTSPTGNNNFTPQNNLANTNNVRFTQPSGVGSVLDRSG